MILHEDVALLDLDAAAIVRRGFADPEVAITGAIGATAIPGLAWWEGTAVGRARTDHVPGGETVGVAPSGAVEAIDGIVLCLSPWAVRTLRFDERLAADFHGYDVELCLQARHHGRRVEVIELAVHHEHRPLFPDTDRWARNELRVRQHWLDHRPITADRHRTLSREAPQGPDRAA